MRALLPLFFGCCCLLAGFPYVSADSEACEAFEDVSLLSGLRPRGAHSPCPHRNNENNDNNNNDNNNKKKGKVGGSSGSDYARETLGFDQQAFDRVFPFATVSSVWTSNPYDSRVVKGSPFWNYESFLTAIDIMEASPIPMFHGFASSNADPKVNAMELAAFLANMQQETGEPALVVPKTYDLCLLGGSCLKDGWCDATHPCPDGCSQKCIMKTQWSGQCTCTSGTEWNATDKRCEDPNKPPVVIDPTCNEANTVCNGPAGGAVNLIEGALVSAIMPSPAPAPFPFPAQLNQSCGMKAAAPQMKGADQPGFGLPKCAFEETNSACVSSDGTLWTGPIDKSAFTPSRFWGASWNKQTQGWKSACQGQQTDKCICQNGTIGCQYGGRGAIQLSYWYNYNQASLDLFGDFRLIVWPNLIIGLEYGKVLEIPGDVLSDTPAPPVMAWLTCFWFWMTHRSGYSFSAHDAMQLGYGITCVNMIINGQAGCSPGEWATEKNVFFIRAGIAVGAGLTGPTLHENVKCRPIDPKCVKR
ncbi:unnamed protein product [Polarella glacialis]|uniref:Chitinase n=1 Tax=Polarella glacialis TaxID=89957 RepID=A0A813DGY8_POLGL|nr:unnamed protein product [Polarella glacialis]CAE8649778.1 unnamed protein product [Polarella glacialis]